MGLVLERTPFYAEAGGQARSRALQDPVRGFCCITLGKGFAVLRPSPSADAWALVAPNGSEMERTPLYAESSGQAGDRACFCSAETLSVAMPVHMLAGLMGWCWSVCRYTVASPRG